MSVLQLADAREYLALGSGQRDTELQATIDAAEAAIAQRCGPLAPTATTARVGGSSTALALTVLPALSLTSITPVGGTAVSLADVYLDLSAGLVTYNAGSVFPARLYDVAYVAGRSPCPADLLMAVRELVRHLWLTRRGPTRRPGSEPSESASNTMPGAAYLLPFRVSELIAPHLLLPGFA